MEEILGLPIEQTLWSHTEEVPLYISGNYELQKVHIMDTDCVFMVPLTNLGTVATVKKHMRKIQDIYHLPVAIRAKEVSNYRRKSMLENRIPFVTDTQVYLPFLGTYLRRQFESGLLIPKVFTVSAQVTAIKWLLHPEEKIKLTKLMDGFGYTAMTLSRVAKQLEATGCFRIEKDGAANILAAKQNARTTFEKMKPYLTSPVVTSGYLELPMQWDYAVAGVEAVAEKTMLNADELHTFAVYGMKKNVLQTELVATDKQAYVEIWRYNPKILSDDGKFADPISVALTLKDIKDERVEGAVNDMLETIWEAQDDTGI